MRVCHPGPVAFQRASVSGGNLRLIATFASGDFGRPRGLSMAAATRAPKIFGSTSFAGRAFAIMSAVHSGFLRTVFVVLDCVFISFHLAFVRLAQTDDPGLALSWRKNHAMQPFPDKAQYTVAPFSIVHSPVFPDKGCRPVELSGEVQ